MNAPFDLAIVGSGFAGSLLAMIARRLGRTVVLLERGKHPRFAIGESSTPLASLLLEALARRYDLPQLLPFTKWGAWQQAYPQIGCGLKRGFTFYHHRFGERFAQCADRANELLVAASPNNLIADTHWYRPDFDHHLVQQAQALGAVLIDETTLEHVSFDASGATLTGQRQGQALHLRAGFVLDASGPRGFLQRALGLKESLFEHLPRTQALFSHFRGVHHFEELYSLSQSAPPYPPDAAALHHVFDGGWIWVLRFNNGLISAGAAMAEPLAAELRLGAGEPAWQRLLARLPAVGEQFAEARAEPPFTHLPQLSFLAAQMTGPRWALLPSAAGFVDPLLSTGFPLTLLGVERLATALEACSTWEKFATRLPHYERQTTGELLAAGRLIGALYASMGDFAVFRPLALLYFAAASFSETTRRLGRGEPALSFLLHDHASFGPGLRQCCEFVLQRAPGHRWSERERHELQHRVTRTLAPFDVAGLGDATRRGWYPAQAEDLLAAAPKLGVDVTAIHQLLRQCGFQ